MIEEYIDKIKEIISNIKIKTIEDRIYFINEIRLLLSEISPFNSEPVDCIQWVKSDSVKANDYNPNSVAPPEMELLRHSINHDGYTQPVVTWKNNEEIEVVDGFHRTRVCKEFEDVNKRVSGYLPVVFIKNNNTKRNDRIASTIRHNRARGKHNVESMTDIVIELKRRNWSNKRIGKELGMDPDEILRLCQVSGLSEMFADEDFSKSWDIDIMSEDDIDFILDEENIEPDKEKKAGRILHTYDNWECHKAGFYNTKPPEGLTKEDCENKYKELLSDLDLFESILKKIISEWKISCEHYLSNDSMNRIAWLGQACLCYHFKIPSCFRSGYSYLTKKQQFEADKMALKYLNIWLNDNGYDELDESIIKNKPKADIY
jgi:hypothetical protein